MTEQLMEESMVFTGVMATLGAVKASASPPSSSPNESGRLARGAEEPRGRA